MGIDFTNQRWERIKENSIAWWKGDLKRPLIQIAVPGHNPGRPAPPLPQHGFTAFYDLSVPAEDIVDRWDYDLSCLKFLGDAFPVVFPNFGPGVLAAFMGAMLEASPDVSTCWFRPIKQAQITDLELRLDIDNVWLRRIMDICRAASERWEGLVQVSMTDLGGNLDVVSSFRPGEELLLDLYDHPEDVKRVTWDAHEMWWRAFEQINQVISPPNPGYSAWAGVFSTEPHYMLQCDFCYMIGPDMFDEFVKPELTASCKRLTHGFYHLDGPGQLPHLDSLLTIPDLKGVQWIPGSGAPDYRYWPDVYRKIRAAGKRIQLYGDPDVLDSVVEQLGSAEGILFIGWEPNETAARACLEKYGVD